MVKVGSLGEYSGTYGPYTPVYERMSLATWYMVLYDYCMLKGTLRFSALHVAAIGTLFTLKPVRVTSAAVVFGRK